MHRTISPKILYFGTPVVLISTTNEDGSANLAPMSSAWWLGKSAMLGLGQHSKTLENLRREGQCVLNLPSAALVGAVDRLALTTGKLELPDYKVRLGFRYVKDKFGWAGLTPVPSEQVAPPRVLECPFQLEAEVTAIHPFDVADEDNTATEVRILRVHAEEAMLKSWRHHIDPDAWRPLMMSFLEFYNLGQKVHPSRLAEVF